MYSAVAAFVAAFAIATTPFVAAPVSSTPAKVEGFTNVISALVATFTFVSTLILFVVPAVTAKTCSLADAFPSLT